MKNIIAPVSTLLPSQHGVSSHSLQQLLGPNFNYRKFNPIPVLQQGDIFLLGGGHNRAFLMILASSFYKEILEVPLAVVESDYDMSNLFEGLFKKFSINEFISYRGAIMNSSNYSLQPPSKIEDMQFDVRKERGHGGDLTYKKAGREENKVYGDNEFLGIIPPLEELKKVLEQIVIV